MFRLLSSYIIITKRTTANEVCYPIPTDYIIHLNIYRVEATCSTKYQFNRKVKFIVNWISGIILFGFDLNCLDQKCINTQAKSIPSSIRNLLALDNSTDLLNNIEILSTDIGNRAYQSLNALLSIIIPILANKESPVISHDDVIKLKLGGNGHEVGRSTHYIMFTVCILNKENSVLDPIKQHCFWSFINELKQLVNQGFENSEKFLESRFMVSSDWKFMVLVLFIL
ncbi:hypothetical protein F8M41_018059 [Gigaspora margarita]|uniref:Uncharacterized protein n=1 Tax=Gigaspora margarita TaxID=4874 RepID=A0A8H4AM26_GIGMA|nr:hypothetical protein F8M41_018059 [Gigaspora margarita]